MRKHECVFDYEFTNSETGEVLVNQLPPTWNTASFGREVGAYVGRDANKRAGWNARKNLVFLGASPECLKGFDAETALLYVPQCSACGEPAVDRWPLTDEPNESLWVRCATCGHDKYVHAHIGYGGCLYGEGCECNEYVHVKSEP